MNPEGSKQEADGRVLIIPAILSQDDDMIIILHHTHSQYLMAHMFSWQASQQSNWVVYE